MKEETFHQRAQPASRSAGSVLVALLAMALFFASTPQSTAQQDNRQLKREQPQPNSAEQRRMALVIGNGAYTKAPPLKNPPNDARDMAVTLKTLGFDVTSGINVNQRDMKRLIREFGQKLKAGGSGLFYYAGHGVQSKGHNYLIPVDADIQSEAEVEDSAVDVNLLLNYMDDAQNGVNIVILDACRDNPFSRSFRSASSGLAQVDAPTGTLIAYATAPGRVASDGTGQNGLYTSELLKQMRVPGLSATEMFMHVRAEVMKQTSNKQVPWEASSLVGTFYFRAPMKNTGTPTSDVADEKKFDPAAFELSYWESIKNSTDPEDFKSYLARYPNGQFAELARRRAGSQGATSQPTAMSEPKGEDKGNTNDATSPFDLGRAALGKNDLDSAILFLNKAVVNDPQLASGWQLLTSAYLRRAGLTSDEAKARADFQSAVHAGEKLTALRSDEENLGLYGRALIGAQQYTRAASVFERVVVTGNASGVTLYLLGLAHSRAKNFPNAIAALEQSMAKSPEDVNVYRELGYDYEKTRQYRKAFDVYQKALQIAPNDADFKEALERVRPFAK